MDVSMPDMNGIDATQEIMEGVPGVRVIGLSMHAGRRYVLGMLEAGACGYLLKDCAFEELATAIRNVAGGPEGMAAKEIAVHFGVRVKTMETHRRNMMEKLNERSITELTKCAVREGLVSIEG